MTYTDQPTNLPTRQRFAPGRATGKNFQTAWGQEPIHILFRSGHWHLVGVCSLLNIQLNMFRRLALRWPYTLFAHTAVVLIGTIIMLMSWHISTSALHFPDGIKTCWRETQAANPEYVLAIFSFPLHFLGFFNLSKALTNYIPIFLFDLYPLTFCYRNR